MKVAVTGSSGLIGTALTASLRADGHQVVRLVRRPPRGGGARPRRRSARCAGTRAPPTRATRRCPGWTPSCTWPARASATTAGPPATRRRSGPAGSLPPAALATALAAARAAAEGVHRRLRDRLVRRHRRPRGHRGRAGRQGVPVAGGARLGGRRRPGPRGGHPRRPPAQRPGARRGRRRARPAGAARPPRGAAPLRRRPPGDELDLAHRRDPRHPLPARRPGRGPAERPVQPDRAQPGHQRRADGGAARRVPAARLPLAARARAAAEARPRRDVGRAADQRPRAARAAARGRLRVQLPDHRGRPRPAGTAVARRNFGLVRSPAA